MIAAARLECPARNRNKPVTALSGCSRNHSSEQVTAIFHFGDSQISESTAYVIRHSVVGRAPALYKRWPSMDNGLTAIHHGKNARNKETIHMAMAPTTSPVSVRPVRPSLPRFWAQ